MINNFKHEVTKMSDFKEFIADTLLSESIISEVKETELDMFEESLTTIETELNEILGLKSLANGAKRIAGALGKANDSADKKVEDVKSKGRAAALAAQIAYNTKKDEVKKKVDSAKKEIGDSIQREKETLAAARDVAKKSAHDLKNAVDKKVIALDIKKQELGKRVADVSKASKEVFKKFFKNLTNLSEDQKKTLADLTTIFDKMAENKAVVGLDAIKIIAVAMSGSSEHSEVPSFKVYSKNLERLRAMPGFTTYAFSARVNK